MFTLCSRISVAAREKLEELAKSRRTTFRKVLEDALNREWLDARPSQEDR